MSVLELSPAELSHVGKLRGERERLLSRAEDLKDEAARLDLQALAVDRELQLAMRRKQVAS